MSTPEQPLIPEISLYRLTSQQSDSEQLERARRLYQVTQRNAHLFSELLQDSTDDEPRPGSNVRNNATTSDFKAGRRHTVVLDFFVPPALDHLKGTSDWLLGTDLVRLQLNRYNYDLPDDIGPVPISDHNTHMFIAPAPEYAVKGYSLDGASAATYEQGGRLDAINTETVIGILTLIAEQRQAELG